MQIYDYGFYKITDENPSSNAKSTNSSESEFSQILADTLQSQETQTQPKLTGDDYTDYQNGLLSDEERMEISIVLDAAQIVVGWDIARQKTGTTYQNFDFVSDKYGGMIKQRETLINGSDAQRAKLLNAYKQAIEDGCAVPSGGQRVIVKTLAYINRVLEGL